MQEITLLDLSNVMEMALMSDDDFISRDSSSYSENELLENYYALEAEYGTAFNDAFVNESTDAIDMEIDDDIIEDINLSDGLSDILSAIEGY